MNSPPLIGGPKTMRPSLVDHVHAALSAAIGVAVEPRHDVVHEARHVVPRDHEVALPRVQPLPVAHEHALPIDDVVQVPQLLDDAGEVHLREEARDEQPAEGVVLRPGGARGEGEDVVILVVHVEDQDGAHARRLARGGGQPAARDGGEARQIDVRGDDVVLRDDQLVEPVHALVGQRQRGVEDRLLAGPLDLERRAERHPAEHHDGHDDGWYQRGSRTAFREGTGAP